MNANCEYNCELEKVGEAKDYDVPRIITEEKYICRVALQVYIYTLPVVQVKYVHPI